MFRFYQKSSSDIKQDTSKTVDSGETTVSEDNQVCGLDLDLDATAVAVGAMNEASGWANRVLSAQNYLYPSEL